MKSITLIKKINSIVVLIFLMISTLGYAQKPAKYVFLFIGDGMGDNQVYATELYKASVEGEGEYTPLSFSLFPSQTFMTTFSADNLTTDSSAAATAMATGEKTDNHVVGMDPSLKISFETVAEKAKKNGFKVGILSSVMIDHATPASFYAHEAKRKDYDRIALQMSTSEFDYFAGGGVHNLGSPEDENSVISSLNKNGYSYLTTAEEIKQLKKGDDKIVAVNPGTYSGKEYFWEIDKRKESISLAYFTRKGIELLENDKGFFMMVEGGKIDWASHSNDMASSIHETLAFDEAVKEAVDFYKKHPNETLIIVTSDHETGGLALGSENSKGLKLGLLQHQKVSAQEFERSLSKLKELKRTISFDEVLDSIQVNFGLGDESKGLALEDAERDWLKTAYNKEFVNLKEINPDRDYLDHYSDKPLTLRAVGILNTKAGIGWTTGGHTGTKVPVKALGVGEEYFRSTIDNTDINDIILKVMQIPNKL